jgi:Trk K+ transport system NAD-binding subunit
MLPGSSYHSLSFIDALFLSASGMSVTGLSTIDVADNLTLVGKCFLLIQIQFGGIGIMAILGVFLILFNKKLSLPHQTLMSFDQNQKSLKSIRKLILFIVSFTLIIECIGFLFFFPLFYKESHNLSHAVFMSGFHSVSSFTNAGFTLLDHGLSYYATNPWFVLGTSVLLIAGVIGFPTFLEFFYSKNKKKSLYTKLNLITHSSLLLIGFGCFYLFERTNTLHSFSFIDSFTNAFFLSVTSRNGGLSTVSIGELMPSSLYILMLLMFIGGSASSCGGGIRTTTFAVLVSKAVSIAKGRRDVVIFKKRVDNEDINKAFFVFIMYFTLFFVSSILLAFVEKMPMESISFEVIDNRSFHGNNRRFINVFKNLVNCVNDHWKNRRFIFSLWIVKTKRIIYSLPNRNSDCRLRRFNMKKFLIIGLGRFGKSVLKELYLSGHEVVGCDRDPQVLNEVEDFSTYLVEGEATDDDVLEEINVNEFDSIIVSIGDNFEAAILIVTKLKNKGCQHIISKANDPLRGQALSAVGADQVVFPEEETGTRLAKQIATPGVLEYIELAPNCTAIEMEVPEEFVGSSLSQLDLRKKYKVTLVLINRKNEEYPIIAPNPEEIFQQEDVIFIIGENKNLERLKRKLKK